MGSKAAPLGRIRSKLGTSGPPAFAGDTEGIQGGWVGIEVGGGGGGGGFFWRKEEVALFFSFGLFFFGGGRMMRKRFVSALRGGLGSEVAAAAQTTPISGL